MGISYKNTGCLLTQASVLCFILTAFEEGREGAGHVSDSVVMPVVSTIVERAIDEAAGRAPEDRWMDLLVEREQNWLVVECAACGEGPELPEETMWRGQRVLLERYEDSFRLRVEMRPA